MTATNHDTDHALTGWTRHLPKAAAVAALALVDPSKLAGWRRGAYTGATAALAAWLTWDELERPSVQRAGQGIDQPAAKVGIAIGVAGLTTALVPLGIAWDAKVMGFLRRMHVPAPRVILALGAFAGQLASDLSPDTSGDATLDSPDGDENVEPAIA